jgi:hypothetical protein
MGEITIRQAQAARANVPVLQVFALCRSEDRIQTFSINNGLVFGLG